MGGEDARVATTVWEPGGISGRAAKERGDLRFQPKDIKAKPGQNAVMRNIGFDASASMTTETWHGKIMGMQGGIRARGRARIDNEEGAGAPPESDEGEANAASPVPNSGQPPPPAHEASEAGAQEA